MYVLEEFNGTVMKKKSFSLKIPIDNTHAYLKMYGKCIDGV